MWFLVFFEILRPKFGSPWRFFSQSTIGSAIRGLRRGKNCWNVCRNQRGRNNAYRSGSEGGHGWPEPSSASVACAQEISWSWRMLAPRVHEARLGLYQGSEASGMFFWCYLDWKMSATFVLHLLEIFNPINSLFLSHLLLQQDLGACRRPGSFLIFV